MYHAILKGLVLGQSHRPYQAMRFVGAACMIIGSLLSSDLVHAKIMSLLPVAGEGVQAAGPAGPTQAWIEFCDRLPLECTVDPSEPATITLSPTIWEAIVDTNQRVNDTILPVTDLDHWNVVDRWDYPDDGLGDCEDIQLLKRKLLVEVGLPRRALRMTVVIDDMGDGHAVLMVRTDRGDFILDNKRSLVLPWQETGYRYVKREGSDNEDWVWLGNQAPPTTTANR